MTWIWKPGAVDEAREANRAGGSVHEPLVTQATQLSSRPDALAHAIPAAYTTCKLCACHADPLCLACFTLIRGAL